MGIDAEIFCGLLMTTILCFLKLYSIHLRMSMAKVIRLLRLCRLQVIGVFEPMPAPVGHGVQGHTCPILKRVALQPGDVDGGGKVTIAHAERSQWVGLGYQGVMTCDDGLAVDGGRGVLGVIT